MDLRTWIQEQFLPVVMVVATPAAEAICQSRNGLSIVDILRPYSQILQLDVPFRVGEFSSRVKDLKLKFHAGSTVYQPKPETIETCLQEVLLQASQKYTKLEPVENLVQLIQSGTTQDFTPWFTEYREEFMRLLAFGDHEAVHYPVACIYVIPSDVSDPVSHFQALQNGHGHPPLMDREIMCPAKEPSFPKHYLLLHDVASHGDDKRAKDNLTAISKTFGGPQCSLLKINSGRGDKHSMGAPPEFYKQFQKGLVPGGGAGEPDARPAQHGQGVGLYLSCQDLDAVSNFVKEFVLLTLLPKLEERINRLNTSITATRRGLRNAVTRLWKRASESAQEGAYQWHTAESQMRQLADMAFLLHHYEFAASMYRLAASDYLAQNNFKWYAGVEEMIGLCSVMEPQEGTDPMKYFLRAYENYGKQPGKLPRMLATRAMLHGAAYQSSVQRYMAASHVLMRAHFEEENARAALLLEQAAYPLLRLKQPCTRRFAFQMVLGGLRYHSCGQKRLALHSYRQVMGLYHGRLWRIIEEHLNDVLGKQCRDMGEAEEALAHFMDLLDCTHRPASTQQHYVNQFIDAVKAVELKRDKHEILDNLALPLVKSWDVQVVYSDQRCWGNVLAREVAEPRWAAMEAAAIPPSLVDKSALGNWLEGARQQTASHEEYNLCVAGEEVSVNVEFRNPLQIKMRVSGVRLLFDFAPHDKDKDKAGGGVPASASAPVLSPLEASELRSPHHPLSEVYKTANQQVVVVEDKFTLHPNEVLVEGLVVRPLVPGWLTIKGVTWLLNESVQGQVMFDVRGRKRRKPKGTRPSQQKHYPPSRRLLFQIIPAMPKLEVSVDMPPAMYQGEVCRVILSVCNTGATAMRQLSVVVDSPYMVLTANNDELTTSMDSCLAGQGSPLVNEELMSGEYRLWHYRLSGAAAALGPGEKLQWPVWLHAHRESLNLACLWFCEPQIPIPGAQLKFRTLRMAHHIGVWPLLRVTPGLHPSPRDLFSNMLRVDMENDKDGDVVSLSQVSCMTEGADVGWRLAFTSGGAAPTRAWHTLVPDLSLSPGESGTVFFQLFPPASETAHQFRDAPADDDQPPLFNFLKGVLCHFHGGRYRAPSTAAGLPLVPSCTAMSTTDKETSDDDSVQGAATLAKVLSIHQHAHRHQHKSRWGVYPAPPPAPPQHLLADPPVDVALVWRITHPSRPLPSGPGERLGVVFLPHCCRAAQSHPIRMQLLGASSLTHDFRAKALCVAPLHLAVRNCCSKEAKLVVEVGEGYDATDASCAWYHISVPPPSTQQPPPYQPQHTGGSVVSDRGYAPQLTGGSAYVPQHTGGSYVAQHTGSSRGGGELGRTSPTPSELASMTPGPTVVSTQAGLPPSSEYAWCGRTRVTQPHLAPGASTLIPLQVAIMKPGMYAITGYRATYTISDLGLVDTRKGEQILVKVEAK